MPDKHSLISPSNSHRAISCPPSVQMELKHGVPKEDNEMAELGTFAHASTQYKVSKALGIGCEKPVSDEFDTAEVDALTDDCAQFTLEQFRKWKKKDPTTKIYLEKELALDEYLGAGGFGTSDVVLVKADEIHIIDYKFGFLPVSVVKNSQLMLYSLGSFKLVDASKIKKVYMTIVQPRLHNCETYVMKTKALLEWGETIKPKIQLALSGLGEFNPTEENCAYCSCKEKCRARALQKMQIAKSDFDTPDMLTDGEIAELIPKLTEIKKWCDDLLAYATEKALDGFEWPGYKLVEGRSNRSYADEAKIIETAKKNDIKDIYKTELLSVAELEKKIGKKVFGEIFGSLICKPAGKPTLVKEDDKRPALTTFNKDFKGEN